MEIEYLPPNPSSTITMNCCTVKGNSPRPCFLALNWVPATKRTPGPGREAMPPLWGARRGTCWRCASPCRLPEGSTDGWYRSWTCVAVATAEPELRSYFVGSHPLLHRRQRVRPRDRHKPGSRSPSERRYWTTSTSICINFINDSAYKHCVKSR